MTVSVDFRCPDSKDSSHIQNIDRLTYQMTNAVSRFIKLNAILLHLINFETFYRVVLSDGRPLCIHVHENTFKSKATVVICIISSVKSVNFLFLFIRV